MKQCRLEKMRVNFDEKMSKWPPVFHCLWPLSLFLLLLPEIIEESWVILLFSSERRRSEGVMRCRSSRRRRRRRRRRENGKKMKITVSERANERNINELFIRSDRPTRTSSLPNVLVKFVGEFIVDEETCRFNLRTWVFDIPRTSKSDSVIVANSSREKT